MPLLKFSGDEGAAERATRKWLDIFIPRMREEIGDRFYKRIRGRLANRIWFLPEHYNYDWIYSCAGQTVSSPTFRKNQHGVRLQQTTTKPKITLRASCDYHDSKLGESMDFIESSLWNMKELRDLTHGRFH